MVTRVNSIADPGTLRLYAAAGSPVRDLVLTAGEAAVLGRRSDCRLTLSNPHVSTRHAEVASRGGAWYITDLGSTNGTTLGSQRLAPFAPAELQHGDLISIGPWTLAVDLDGGVRRTDRTIDDTAEAGGRIERIAAEPATLGAQRRLNLLVEVSAAIQAARSATELHEATLKALISGTRFARAAWIRPSAPGAETVEVVRRMPDGDAEPLRVSRALLREASHGEAAKLAGTVEASGAAAGASIQGLGIHTAICVPVMIGPTPTAFLYLDCRGGEDAAHAEAAGFCQAVARISGLALSNLRRVELEDRQRRMEVEMEAARAAQRLVMPPEVGRVPPLKYTIVSRAGFLVAGDLFDVVPLGPGRVAVCLGDVTGEGLGAAMLMVAAQTYLHAALRAMGSPGAAVRALNDYLVARGLDGRFVTMWVGVFDAQAGAVKFVDAGHGYWLVHPAGHAPRRVPHDGGIPVGIEAGHAYIEETLILRPGDAVILFSDGMIEQRGPGGEQFGWDRVIQSLRGSQAGPESLLRAVEDHAGRPQGATLDDDATAARIQWIGDEQRAVAASPTCLPSPA